VNRPALTESTVVTRSREPVAVEVDRTVVMMSIEREKYYSLDGVGGRIWELLRDPCTLGELNARLLDEFDVDPEECKADVQEFLTHLLDEGLIEVRSESPDPVRTTPSA